MNLKKYRYYPLLKTTQAELKAYDNLPNKVKEDILPIFELTKGRISKKDKIGDVGKSIEKLNEVVKSRRFILDLTTEQMLKNSQIQDIFDNTENGYSAWQEFLEKLELIIDN